MNPKQIEAVLKLSGHDRYRHFLKVVADKESAWGLYEDGWALAADDDGNPVFPLWPAKEYAALCAVGEWAGYEPSDIDVDELLEELLPSLMERGTRIGIFPSPSEKGVSPELDRFEQELRDELSQYE
ncbi:DUF2750 domain-containing protein [Brevifollis gellanilyticus]|uniref:DUF2750 domain-containing protein n=1 Tax=Brevifollis gellanilyticus TaxID=748831 RepID=A0A512M6M2_9BACT|nr:DUF2750 domain-containing protein [Brevifollis gellanilyticus]GEP42374.1 hypothetical protein BGE01nite_16650 [Brevifollis gellanilyticus]